MGFFCHLKAKAGKQGYVQPILYTFRAWQIGGLD